MKDQRSPYLQELDSRAALLNFYITTLKDEVESARVEEEFDPGIGLIADAIAELPKVPWNIEDREHINDTSDGGEVDSFTSEVNSFSLSLVELGTKVDYIATLSNAVGSLKGVLGQAVKKAQVRAMSSRTLKNGVSTVKALVLVIQSLLKVAAADIVQIVKDAFNMRTLSEWHLNFGKVGFTFTP